nr:HXXEE domain-containing protein [Bacillus alkalicellulosilyticus]
MFTLHNLEEIITVEKWIQETYPRVCNKIPSSIQKRLNNYKDVTSSQFAVVVFVFSFFVSLLILLAVMTQHYYLFVGVLLFFGLNILTHPLQSLYLRCYTPGVLTSLLLIIPYYSLFFYQFYNTELLTFTAIVVMFLLIPVFFLSHKLGEMWN